MRNIFSASFFACMLLLGGLCLGSVMQVAAARAPVAVPKPYNQTIYAGSEAFFTGHESYHEEGVIVSYYWDFHDGSHSSDINTSHVYNFPGNYTVTLEVTDEVGEKDNKSVNVTVLEIPPGSPTVWIESFTTDKEQYNVKENIDAYVSVLKDDGGIPSIWYGTLAFEVFDGSMKLVHYEERNVTIPEVMPAEIWAFHLNLSASGNHLVRATLYDDAAVFMDRNDISINVVNEAQNQPPVAVIISDFTKTEVGTEIWFHGDKSHDVDGNISFYQWDFGDGNFTTGTNASHIYVSQGNYTITLTVFDNLNSKSNVSFNLEVVNTLNGLPDKSKIRSGDTGFRNFLAFAGLGTLSIFLLAFATEAGKYRFLGLLIPLYTRLNRKDLLDNFSRGKIYGYIMANPGDHYNSIKKALKLADGVFSYHIHLLENEGFIKSQRDGTHRRFYPSEMRIPENGDSLKKSQQLIMEKIKEAPGISQKDIAILLGVSSATINYHLKELLKRELIRGERAGMRIRYYVNSEKGQEISHALPESKMTDA